MFCVPSWTTGFSVTPSGVRKWRPRRHLAEKLNFNKSQWKPTGHLGSASLPKSLLLSSHPSPLTILLTHNIIQIWPSHFPFTFVSSPHTKRKKSSSKNPQSLYFLCVISICPTTTYKEVHWFSSYRWRPRNSDTLSDLSSITYLRSSRAQRPTWIYQKLRSGFFALKRIACLYLGREVLVGIVKETILIHLFPFGELSWRTWAWTPYTESFVSFFSQTYSHFHGSHKPQALAWHKLMQLWWHLYFCALLFLTTCCCSVAQSCPTLCNPMKSSPPGSSIHGILQARILAWVAMPLPGDLPHAGMEPHLPHWQACSLPLSHQGSPFSAYLSWKSSPAPG